MIWIPELVFDNTEYKQSTLADNEASGTIQRGRLVDSKSMSCAVHVYYQFWLSADINQS